MPTPSTSSTPPTSSGPRANPYTYTPVVPAATDAELARARALAATPVDAGDDVRAAARLEADQIGMRLVARLMDEGQDVARTGAVDALIALGGSGLLSPASNTVVELLEGILPPLAERPGYGQYVPMRVLRALLAVPDLPERHLVKLHQRLGTRWNVHGALLRHPSAGPKYWARRLKGREFTSEEAAILLATPAAWRDATCRPMLAERALDFASESDSTAADGLGHLAATIGPEAFVPLWWRVFRRRPSFAVRWLAHTPPPVPGLGVTTIDLAPSFEHADGAVRAYAALALAHAVPRAEPPLAPTLAPPAR